MGVLPQQMAGCSFAGVVAFSIVLVALQLPGTSSQFLAQGCRNWVQMANELQLSSDNTIANNITTAMPQYTCHTWRLDSMYSSNDFVCKDPGSWLLLEFYRMAPKQGSWDLDQELVSDVYFMAARDGPPNVALSSNSVAIFNPEVNPGTFPANPSPNDLGSNAGTFVQEDAVNYMRTYQRLLIPNITAGTPVWWITVANLAQPAQIQFGATSTTVQGYSIRATCLAARDVPCPRPLPNAGPCSVTSNVNTGTCKQDSPDDPTSLVCACNPNFGDYGCNKQLTSLSDSGQTTAVSLQLGGWSYYKVQVPVSPQSVSSQVLVVDFRRSASSGMGADPVLFVKPIKTTDRNTPFYTDAIQYGDIASFRYEQSFHYQVIRDFGSGSDLRNEFYIAIFNNYGRYNQGRLVGQLRVRWGTPGQPFICPGDCYGRGACMDPKTLNANWMGSVAYTQYIAAGFFCNCTDAYGGLMCEGSLAPVSVSTSGQTVLGSLSSGEWAYLQLNIDPRKFNFRSDDLYINWKINDAAGQPGNQLNNALITFDEDEYPQQSSTDSNNPYKRGMMTTYSALVGDNKLPQQFDGASLRQGSYYIVGMYNSEYIRSSAFYYQVEVFVPAPTAAWLHPYMSVVLGITAAIVLCLVMTLCKRMVMRNGWGPFSAARRQQYSQDGGTGSDGGPRHAMLQIMPRHQGVPQGIIDRFPTYEYQAPPPVADKGTVLTMHMLISADRPSAQHRHLDPHISRSQREALQAAAAEAATTAASAVRALQQQQQHTGPEAAAAAACTPVGVGDQSAVPTGTAAEAPAQLPGPEEASAMAAAAKVAAAAHHRQAAAEPGIAAGSTDAGDGKLPPLAPEGDDAPTCTVCLCEYEEDDLMRRLPCHHEFHKACIDKWMTQHTTCPICREPLITPQELAALQDPSSSVAVIYIPQAVRRMGVLEQEAGQPGVTNSTSGAAGGDAARLAGSHGGGRVTEFLSWLGLRRGGANGLEQGGAGAGGPPMTAGRGGNPPGWHVTMAWGSPHAGGDPFASPLPMNGGASGRHTAAVTPQPPPHPPQPAPAPAPPLSGSASPRLQPMGSATLLMQSPTVSGSPRAHLNSRGSRRAGSPRAIVPEPSL